MYISCCQLNETIGFLTSDMWIGRISTIGSWVFSFKAGCWVFIRRTRRLFLVESSWISYFHCIPLSPDTLCSFQSGPIMKEKYVLHDSKDILYFWQWSWHGEMYRLRQIALFLSSLENRHSLLHLLSPLILFFLSSITHARFSMSSIGRIFWQPKMKISNLKGNARGDLG